MVKGKEDEQLKQTQERIANFRALLQDYTKEFQCVLDVSGNIMIANGATIVILGYSQAELEGKSIFDFVASDDFGDTFEEVKDPEILVRDSYVLAFNHKDGQQVFLKVKFQNIRNQFGGAIMAFAQDVTELIDTQKRLSEQTDKSNQYQARLLSAQLNPHFIFNALNSMQFFIINENIEEGLEYVSDFSNLIRTVLQNSAHNLITIEEEIDFLNKYLVVEKHRMQGKLEYSIELDDDINGAVPTIPPMLIQPYVENTIVHGFTHKTGKGNVCLRFRREDDQIFCEIEDDGVGREKALEMKQSNTKDFKKSMSMSINQNRLELLEKHFQKKFEVDVVDMYDDDKNPTGTKVVIRIPLLQE